MEEDIKILEEIVEIYYDCAGNKEQDYDMRVDIAFMKKEVEALELLIEVCKKQSKTIKELEGTYRICSKEYIIPKSKVKEMIEELDKQRIKMEKDDVGVGFTLGNDWSDLKAKIKVLQQLLEE